MELDLLKTFVALEAAGTMSTAAQRLYVTQATVSARVAQLETLVGQRLFERSRAGAHLTEEGRRFAPFARQLLLTWQDAVGAARKTEPVERLSIGGEYALSTSLLLSWLTRLRKKRPALQLRTSVQSAEQLLDGVQSGALDIVTLYSPLKRSGVRTQLVLQEELVCVSTERGCRSIEASNYVYVDWGPDFAAAHKRACPELEDAATHIGLGPLALRYLLSVGGCGYFRTRAVEPYFRTKQLHRVRSMPKFSYSLYAASTDKGPRELLDWALQQLIFSAGQAQQSWI